MTEGFKEAADKFRAESGIEPCSDLSTLDDRIKVREAVLGGNIQLAIALVNDLYPQLLDSDRLLCFHLQVDACSSFSVSFFYCFSNANEKICTVYTVFRKKHVFAYIYVENV